MGSMANIKAAQAFLYDVTVMYSDGSVMEVIVSSANKLAGGDTLMVTGAGGKSRIAVIEPAGIMHPQSVPSSKSSSRCYIRRDQLGRAVASVS